MSIKCNLEIDDQEAVKYLKKAAEQGLDNVKESLKAIGPLICLNCINPCSKKKTG